MICNYDKNFGSVDYEVYRMKGGKSLLKKGFAFLDKLIG